MFVTTNPPYMTENHGVKNPDEPKAIARHEIKCNLEDVVRESAKLLKPKGRFYMVHRPFRLPEILRKCLCMELNRSGCGLCTHISIKNRIW